MKVLKQKVFLVILAVLSAENGVIAQTVADSLELPEVVIRERYSDREIRSTAPLQILSRKTIRNLHALQLSDAVKYFSGVTVKDYGGIGGLKTISVRSLGAGHTGVNYNGVAISDLQTGQIDIGRFSLGNVESITLHNGQNDRIFMPARAFASASALNIISSSPLFSDDEIINGQAAIKGGSFGLFNPSFHANVKVSDRLSASFSGEWMSAGGTYPYLLHYGTAGTDSTSIETRENSDVKNLRLETAFYADLSEKSKGELRIYHYHSERGLPGATIFYNSENYSKQRLWDRTFFTQGRLEHAFSRKWLLQANAKYNRGYLRYLDPTWLGADSKVDDTFTQQETYGSLSLLYRAFERLSFSLATDLTGATMHANRKAFATPSRLTSQSVVATKWVTERLLATASLLYTRTVETARNGVPADNSNKFSPYFSASLRPFSELDLRMRAFYKNSFRLPTFNDLYYPVVGVRQLLPEDAHQFNTGVTFSSSAGDVVPLLILSADAYHNRIKNKIVAYPTGNLHQWTMMNFGRVTINGMDVTLESILSLPGNIPLSIGGTYTYQRAMDKTDPGKQTYNHQLPYTPRHSGSARAALEMGWFNVAYTLLWSGGRFSNGYNSDAYRMSGYSDHSISLSRSLQTPFGIIDLAAEALNLSGRNYEIVRNYPMPGRSYRIQISINF